MPIKSKIAAIDIGSNAMRVALANHFDDGTLTVFKNYRFPLRLGSDAFSAGRLSPEKIKLTQAAFAEVLFKLAKYNVTEVKAVATSALRHCSNATALIRTIKEFTGIEINIIDGLTEAKLIKLAVDSMVDLRRQTALLIDIGGGSTEIILTQNDRIKFMKSYPCGTVRLLQSGRNIEHNISEFTNAIRKDIQAQLGGSSIDICIGTGGNLRSLGKLRKQLFERSPGQVTFTELMEIYQTVKATTLKERIKRFDMKKDRADVIIPAMALVEQIMVDHNITSIHLPRVGLKEGLMISLLPKPPAILHIPLN